MPLRLGTTTPSKLYLGTSEVTKAYLGTGEVYSSFSFDPDAQAYITAVEAADTQALEAAVKTAINDFVVGCKADGIWAAINASCILAGARTLTGALVPLKGPAPTNLNFVAGDYVRTTGLLGNGTSKYLNSNQNNNVQLQNSSHLSVYTTTFHTRNATRAVIGNFGSGGGSQLMTIGTTAIYFRINWTVSGAFLASAATNTGLWGASRADSAGTTGRFGGTNYTITDASSTTLSGNNLVFARTPNNPQNFSNARIAFYSIGESIDLALLDTRVTNLINAYVAAI